MAQPDAPLEHLLTVREAAARLHLTTYTVYRMVKSGYLPALHLGRTVRIYSTFQHATSPGTSPGTSTGGGGAGAPTPAVPARRAARRKARTHRRRAP